MNRAIGAVVVTIPSVSYILWPKPKNNHGHGHGSSEEHGDSEAHEEHNDETKNEDGDTEDGDAQNEQAKNDENLEGSGAGQDGTIAEEGGADDASGAAEDNESDDKSSSEEEQGQDTPESSDDEQAEDATKGQEEAQFKGPKKDGPPSDHRTSIPDSKGSKRRISSDYAKPQEPAEGENAVDNDSDDTLDKVSYRDLFAERPRSFCFRCYELRINGFFSGCGRQASRKPHYHVWQTRRYFQYGHEALNRYQE